MLAEINLYQRSGAKLLEFLVGKIDEFKKNNNRAPEYLIYNWKTLAEATGLSTNHCRNIIKLMNRLNEEYQRISQDDSTLAKVYNTQNRAYEFDPKAVKKLYEAEASRCTPSASP